MQRETTRKHWALAGAGLGTIVTATAAVTLGLFAGSGSAASAAPPVNTQPPTITGTPVQGEDLTAHVGTWTNKPTDFAIRWLRCDKSGGSCAGIGGATDSVYTLKGVDVGNTLRVRVTASNASGSSSATSAPTAVIATKPPVTGCPPGNGPAAVTAVDPPARLVLDRFQFDPAVVHRGTTQITARFHVSDTCGQSVAGALVYAAAVPFNQFSVSEQPTDQNGIATLQLSRLGSFPVARNQGLLVFFVRARKPGENVLTGIGNRRLVSVPVNLSS
jgi:hypothetical protein